MAIRKYVGDKITGLSSDTKPSNVSDGATFYETDTLKIFIRVSGTWSEVPTGGSFSGCRAYKSSGQSLTTSFSAITFDTEDFDTDTYHDNVTNNTRFTAPSTGYYSISGMVATDGNAITRIQFRLNGSTVIHSVGVGNVGASSQNGMSSTIIYSLTAGDYVEMLGAFGSTQTTTSGVSGTQFSIHKIG